MVTVNIKRLVEAIEEADAFRLPDMNAGTEYLYNNLYHRLSKSEDVTLSSLDFGAFEQDDITSLNRLYTDVFERNCYAASNIMSTLVKIDPVCRTASFV